MGTSKRGLWELAWVFVGVERISYEHGDRGLLIEDVCREVVLMGKFGMNCGQLIIMLDITYAMEHHVWGTVWRQMVEIAYFWGNAAW